MEDVVASLDLTFAHAGAVIAGVRPEHLDGGTPCAEWSVRELLEHMIGVVDGIGWTALGFADNGWEKLHKVGIFPTFWQGDISLVGNMSSLRKLDPPARATLPPAGMPWMHAAGQIFSQTTSP